MMTTAHCDTPRSRRRRDELEYGLLPETVARRLYAKARKVGSEWKTRCPAHDDRNPSLSIKRGDHGDLIVKCWAGCNNHAVIAALEERYSISVFSKPLEAWPADPKANTTGSIADLLARGFRIVCAYDYRDESGAKLYENVRLEIGHNGSRSKTFRPRRPNGWGGHIE